MPRLSGLLMYRTISTGHSSRLSRSIRSWSGRRFLAKSRSDFKLKFKVFLVIIDGASLLLRRFLRPKPVLFPGSCLSTRARTPGCQRRFPRPPPESRGTDPSTMMSANTPVGDCAVSPPANGTRYSAASRSNPRMNRSTQLCAKSPGSAKDRNTASGSPPIAAISLNPRVKHRCPTDSGGCHSRRKWTPSRLKSVVTSSSCPAGGRKTAQSSPIPLIMPVRRDLAASARLRTRAINCLSGRGTHQLYSAKAADS